MEIKEAVRIIKETDESEMESLSNAILIEKAETKIMDCIKNGYTLCKVKEALEKMDDLIEIVYADDSGTYKNGHTNGVSECIEIIKEACK